MKPSSLLAAILFGTCLLRGPAASASPLAGGPWRLSVFVNVSNGARALGYATVTDVRTGDPYLLTGQLAHP
jgi:hypothetical protein